MEADTSGVARCTRAACGRSKATSFRVLGFRFRVEDIESSVPIGTLGMWTRCTSGDVQGPLPSIEKTAWRNSCSNVPGCEHTGSRTLGFGVLT